MASAVHIAAGGFTPTDITGLQVWLDASDATTFTFGTGTQVATWTSKVNSHSFAQATSGNQPTRNGTQNSLSTVAFAGASSQYLQGPDAADIGTGSLTMAMTGKAATGTGFFYGKGSTTGQWFLYMDNNFEAWFRNGANRITNGAKTANFEQLTVIIDRPNGTLTLRKDGATLGTPATWTPEFSNQDTANNLMVGAFQNLLAGYFLTGEIGEICHYNSVLTGTDLTNIESYLATKWNA